MQNILNQRQNAYKVTANSLYGQTGAKTSTFYEPDVAASTTAIGRKCLIFAKKINLLFCSNFTHFSFSQSQPSFNN